MLKISGLATCLGLASAAQAGDRLEGYFLVIGTVPSTLAATEMADFAAPVFRETLNALSRTWSEKCNVPVSIWHSNLMDNPDDPWKPDLWFAYLTMSETESEAYANAPATGCISESYVKRGSQVIPTSYQICASGPEFYPDIYNDLCTQ